MYVDLFAGCGGLSYGLYKSGWQGLFAVEKNEDAFTTLKYNLIEKRHHFFWPEWLKQEPIDINILIKDYRKELEELRERVSLVVGGPPCQGFSMAGKRKGNDVRNKLYNSYIDFVKIVQPKMIFFENVHGFTLGFKYKYKGQERHGEPYSEKLIKQLRKLGYDVAFREINMSEYGIPQKRKRFILFAIKSSKAELFFYELEKNRSTFLEDKGLSLPITVEEAIGDLLRRYGEVSNPDTPLFKNGIYGELSSPYQKLMRKQFTSINIPNSHRFARSKSKTIDVFKQLMAISDEMIRITPQMGLVDGLKKRGITPLKARCVCPTITSIPDDFVHYLEPRIMTVRECARIQSFPDDYEFLGKYTTGGDKRKNEVPRYTQVANAIPPLFAEQAGIALRKM